MSTRKTTLLPILTPILHALEREYGKYKQRNEYAFRLSDNKELVKDAVHDVWNAFDHFARAFKRALELESGVRQRPKKSSAAQKKRPAKELLWLEVDRGSKHFAAAQFHCIRYSIAKRMEITGSLLESKMARMDPRIEPYRKKFSKLERSWRAKRNVIRAPAEQGCATRWQAREEIRKIKESNAKMDIALHKLDQIHLGVRRRLRGRVVV
jgi:hypothetical protein